MQCMLLDIDHDVQSYAEGSYPAHNTSLTLAHAFCDGARPPHQGDGIMTLSIFVIAMTLYQAQVFGPCVVWPGVPIGNKTVSKLAIALSCSL